MLLHIHIGLIRFHVAQAVCCGLAQQRVETHRAVAIAPVVTHVVWIRRLDRYLIGRANDPAFRINDVRHLIVGHPARPRMSIGVAGEKSGTGFGSAYREPPGHAHPNRTVRIRHSNVLHRSGPIRQGCIDLLDRGGAIHIPKSP